MNNGEEKEIAQIEEERMSLEEKLALLKKQQNAILKKTTKKKIEPIGQKRFRKDNKKFNNVSSKIDYNLIMTQKEKQEEERQRQKEEIEMAECTFRPKIDEQSKKLTVNKDVIFERELPKKVEQPKVEEEEKESEGEEDEMEKGPKRKFNPKFYQEKVSWKNDKLETHNKIRMDNTLKEISRVKMVPKTNKKQNEKLFKKDKDFLKRVEQDISNSKNLKKKLDEIYNKNTFKPAIHHNNDIKPQVFDHKSGLYLSLKNK
jgi:hypothetical protein